MTDRPGSFLRALSAEAGARVLAIEATVAAVELCERHGLGPHASKAAAEGLVAAQLLSAYIKGEERLTLQVQAEDPRFALIVDVNADGSTRGRFTPSHIPPAERFQGAVLVIKHDAKREIYRGVAPVEDVGFQGALQAYLVHSQQAVGFVRVHASVDDEGRVLSARGLLVEKLPDQETSIFEGLFGDLAEAELDPVLERALGGDLWGFPLQILEERALRFRCQCSHERSLGILAALGVQDLNSLLDEQQGAELTCNFCREVYSFSVAELTGLIEELSTGEGQPSR